MSPKVAAEIMLAHTQDGQYGSERSAAGATPEHAVWMLNQIVDGEVEHDKAHRWIGYAQGVLVSEKVVSLEQCKAANQAA